MPGAIGVEPSCSGTRAYENLVENSVIGAGKHGDPVTPGHRARDADGCGDRLGSCIAEGGPLHTHHVANEPSDLTGHWRLRPDLNTPIELFLERVADELRIVPEKHRAEPVYEIDILIAVHIPETRAEGAISHNGIHDLLPALAEARNRAWVSKMGPVFGRQLLGLRRPVAVAPGELVQAALLLRRELPLAVFGGRPIGTESILARTGLPFKADRPRRRGAQEWGEGTETADVADVRGWRVGSHGTAADQPVQEVELSGHERKF